jgi:tetratricopeptide (TPR) repeat protein
VIDRAQATAMRLRRAAALGFVAYAMVCSSRAAPAEQQPSQAPQVLGTAQSEQEFDAYRGVVTAREPRALAQAAEQFLQTYPDSGLAAYVHQSAMQAYYQFADMAQVIRHGEAALRDLHGNAVLLGLVSAAYLDQGQPAKAVECARAALEAITKMDLPERVDRAAQRAQLNALDSAVHLTLGSALLDILLHAPGAADAKPELAEAISSLQQALMENPASEDASYRLAIASDARDNPDEALRYYAWTVALGGARASSADSKLKELCRSRGRSETDAIAGARAEIEKGMAHLRLPDSKH